MFQVIDFIIFALFLLLSIIVGVYHGIKARFTKYKHSGSGEFFIRLEKMCIFEIKFKCLIKFLKFARI